ncbi:MAG: V4R domain-containing protein [Carboxydocellales bacterium]
MTIDEKQVTTPPDYRQGGQNNQLLTSLNFNQDCGELLLNNTRYLLIRPETVMTFQREAEVAFGSAVGQILFQGGYRGGRLSAETFGQSEGRQGAAVASYMADMGTQLGWGKLLVTQCSLESGRLEVEVENSVFAKGYGKSDHPVCHLIRGVFAGVAEVMFQSPVEGEEVTCLARGDHCCRFSYQAREGLPTGAGAT